MDVHRRNVWSEGDELVWQIQMNPFCTDLVSTVATTFPVWRDVTPQLSSQAFSGSQTEFFGDLHGVNYRRLQSFRIHVFILWLVPRFCFPSVNFISTRDSWKSKELDHFSYQFPCWRLQCQSIEYHFGAKLHDWIFQTFPSWHYLFFILSKLSFMNVSKSFKSVTAECTILQKTSGNISFSFFFLRSISMAVCAISFM